MGAEVSPILKTLFKSSEKSVFPIMQKLTIIVPAYNNESALHSTIQQLLRVEDELLHQDTIGYRTRLLIVDDGSHDQTWQTIQDENQFNHRVTGILLSRHFGYDNALLAGLQSAVATSDVLLTIDANLQNDPAIIPAMLGEYGNGADIVVGQPVNGHHGETAQKAAANFRVMSKRAVRALLAYKEHDLSIANTIPMLGFTTATVAYTLRNRDVKKQHRSLYASLKSFWDNRFANTLAPVHGVVVLGAACGALGLLALAYSVVAKILGTTTLGWTSLMSSIWILGGILMVSIGLIGEYVGKIPTEAQQRPQFTIEAEIGNQEAVIRQFDKAV